MLEQSAKRVDPLFGVRNDDSVNVRVARYGETLWALRRIDSALASNQEGLCKRRTKRCVRTVPRSCNVTILHAVPTLNLSLLNLTLFCDLLVLTFHEHHSPTTLRTSAIGTVSFEANVFDFLAWLRMLLFTQARLTSPATSPLWPPVNT